MKIFICSASFLFLFFLSLNTYSQVSNGEDERILVTVDSVETTATFPEWLKEPNITGQTRIYRQPDEGNVYIFIHISIVEKNDLLVEMSERRLTKTHLIDDEGESHFSLQQQTNINFSDGYPKKETGFIIFETPNNIKPVLLNYFYQYRENNEEGQDIKIGQIGVELL
ncbi:MAG: hypothetical protein JXA61_06720 [Bacteroidales bacterium]|nr:hypothetical protein [Bacteroidales bacterium]